MNAPPLPHRSLGTAHIFCDESGGSDQANTIFLAAAVAVVPADAAKLLKSFRKATRGAGEVKGHRLSANHRAVFFDLLGRLTEASFAVVACSRLETCGGWAMGHLPEVDLYGHLLSEACTSLPSLARAGHLTVTLDGGRYKKAHLDPVRQHVTQAMLARYAHTRVSTGFGDSATLPGLQVADVVANTAFQSFGATEAAQAAQGLLAPLVAQGRLLIQPVCLEDIRPDWLGGA